MVQLVSYGLTGLAAMLVITFACAHHDETRPQAKSSYDQINNARVIDSPTIPEKNFAVPDSW